MDFLIAALQALAAAAGVATSGYKFGYWMVGHIRKTMQDSCTEDVRQFLHNLGCLNEAEVRQLVENWAATVKIAAAQQEELIALFTNLIHGARFHTQQGTPRSSYVRCEHLIEQLLNNIQPRRSQGESVGPGRQEWILERFLGMGTFGEVWLGRNALVPEPRAFKFFTHEGGSEWLQHEQRALYQVRAKLKDHPNIIQLEDVVIAGQPWPFLVLEYIGGGSLDDWIVTRRAERGALEARPIIEGIARGLARAHGNSIYHRDLKPANILLMTESGTQPKIADFGLGQVVQGLPATGASMQASGPFLVGTPMYLPPEANDPYLPRSPAQDDVFAIGIIWYQMLLGALERPPYDFIDQLHSRGVDTHTIRLIDRCLAHPSRRFEDAQDLLDALEHEEAPPTWKMPEGCLDVGSLASEYLSALTVH